MDYLSRIIRELGRFQFGNGSLFLAQIFLLCLLGYFLIRSLVRDVPSAEAFPALNVGYMLLSAIYIFVFIGHFDEISKDYLAWFDYSYRNYYQNKNLFLDDERLKELHLLQTWMAVALGFVLSAFAFNFAKAFSTLSSLEVGSLNGERLAGLGFGKWTKRIEGTLRFIIATAFIFIEKDLFDWNHGGRYDFVKLFASLAIVLFVLYILLLVWYGLLARKIWNKASFKIWKFLAPLQFLMGAALALIYFFFSRLNENNVVEWQNWLRFTVIGMIALSILIAIIIVVTEVLSWNQNQTSTP